MGRQIRDAFQKAKAANGAGKATDIRAGGSVPSSGGASGPGVSTSAGARRPTAKPREISDRDLAELVRSHEAKLRGQRVGSVPRRSTRGEGVTERQKRELNAHLRKLEQVYGGGSGPANPTARAPRAAPVAVKVGPFEPHPLFSSSASSHGSRVLPEHPGIEGQIAKRPSDAAELILGLDFGTSAVKAVIRDHTAGQAFAVPFSTSSTNPFLLPSHIFRRGTVYSLERGEDAIRDLKLRLMGSAAPHPVDEFNDACAFLALVIRHCRGWLLSEYAPRYRRHALSWRVNMGLPARWYEDDTLVNRFRRLAWAAANLARDDSAEITESLVATYRQLAFDAFGQNGKDELFEGFEFAPEDVDVVPEIAAQVFGFVQSSRWDPQRTPMMMMVDVGAGTVDAAVFSVVRQARAQLSFTFFADEVEPLGVMNLHRARVDWLTKLVASSRIRDAGLEAYLAEIARPTDRVRAIPDDVNDYLGGVRIDFPAGARSIDEEFYRGKYSPQIFKCIRVCRKEKGIPDNQLVSIPLFVCGGGARMHFYSQIAVAINIAPINMTVQLTRLPFPTDLEARGVNPTDYDRLSVAYGLSWEGAGGHPLGRIIRSMDIPPTVRPQKADYDGRFISKDQV
jgi:hypothetical protein